MGEKIRYEKGPSLYELSEEMKTLLQDMEDWAEENDGDVTNYPAERFDKIQGEVKDKVLKCAILFKEWRDLGKAIKAQEDAAAARRKAHTNRGERLRKYMESCLPPNAKFEDDRASVGWKKNPPAVEVLVPVDILPEKFTRRADPEADKAELKAGMVPYEVQMVDSLGTPLFDGDGKPLLETVMEVRWPMPTGEKKMVAGNDDGGDPIEVDVMADRTLARLVQGKSLVIN